MATTTNYSWTTPDDTDLVKDGAAAIRTLGSAIDTSFAADQGDLLLGGTSDIFEPLARCAADSFDKQWNYCILGCPCWWWLKCSGSARDNFQFCLLQELYIDSH
jgi:hypothetical protein